MPFSCRSVVIVLDGKVGYGMAVPMPAPQKSVLIVEDDTVLNELLSMLFRKTGFSVVSCVNGVQALEHMRATHFDAVLLDLLMPEKDGFEVLQERSTTQCAATPVFVLTAVPSDENVVKATKLGATRVLSKTQSGPHEVAKVVQQALGL